MRRGAKREFLKNQVLTLQRHSRRRLFFLGGCQETFLPHDIHHSSFIGYKLHTTVCCSGTAGNKVRLVHFQRFPYSVYSSTAVRNACGIVARTATQPTRSTLRTLGVEVLPLLLTAGLSPPACSLRPHPPSALRCLAPAKPTHPPPRLGPC